MITIGKTTIIFRKCCTIIIAFFKFLVFEKATLEFLKKIILKVMILDWGKKNIDEHYFKKLTLVKGQ